MSYLKIPALITEALLSISSNKYVLLILINIFLLVLGCIMDVAPLIVITTPVLLPVITQIGMNTIQFGMMMLCNLAIGMCTPPVGATLFAGCAVGKIPMEKCMKGLLPFYLAMLAVVLLCDICSSSQLDTANFIDGCLIEDWECCKGHAYRILNFVNGENRNENYRSKYILGSAKMGICRNCDR